MKGLKVILVFLCTLTASSHAQFKLGIENIPASLIQECKSKNLRIGLITNQTGKDQHGNRTADILLKKGFNIVCMFAPEHGFDGKTEREKEIQDGVDVKTGIPVLSLYVKDTGKKISPEMLTSIDVLFFDIQDSGMRHYTYISTLFNAIKAAGQENKKIVVFDRPNPLGRTMEGPLVEASLISFISIAPIPLRHGLTVGELAEYFNLHLLEKKADLTVVAMKEYERTMPFENLLAPLSPNIACAASCHGYSFLGLVGEIRPFDVGVGTPHAFQIIALPESLALCASYWQQLAQQLKILGIPTMPHRFMHERKKEYYAGLRLNITNINQVAAFNAFLATVLTMKKAGVQIDFNANFDKAVGSKLVRLFLMGMAPYQELVNEVNQGLQHFFQKAQIVFKYLPHPELLFH